MLNIIDKLSVHNTVNLIRSFDKNPKFVLTFILQKFLHIVNIKKLKNSFMQIFQSKTLWTEINKMINTQFLTFSNSFLCRGNQNFSLLSEYVFEIYLEDLNLFINDIFLKYNTEVFLLSNVCEDLSICISPLKFGKQRFSNIKDFFIFSYKNLDLPSAIRNSEKITNLKRCFNLFMYKYYFCILFSGSKYFSYFIKQKIFSFIKSNLHFDILECATR